MAILSELTPRGAVLALLAVLIGLLAVGLAVAPANRQANRLLAAALLVLAGVSAAYTIEVSRLDRAAGWLRHLPLSVPLALGPLLYGYVVRLTTGAPPRWLWLHLAPGLLQALYLAAAYLVLTPRQQAVLGSPGGDPLGPLWEAAVLLSLTGYGLGCLGALHRYRLWLVEHRADDDVWAGHWIRAVLLGLLAGLAGQAAYWGYAFLSARPDVFDLYPFHLGLAGVGVYLGMEGRRFGDRPFPHEGGAPPPAPEPAPAGEALRDWRATGEAWRERLHAAEWWREPGLTLAELARRLGTNTNHLSRALNEGLGQNFSAVVNGMRAEEVARVLGGPEGDRDLLELAFDSGFSSKASFNRAFRAVHGCSPSEFRARGRLRS